MSRVLMRLIFTLVLISNCYAYFPEKRITIVTASYNNKDYLKKNLDSIFNQNYSNYELAYTDDCSSDGTGALVTEYIKENGFENCVRLTLNSARMGTLYNQYRMIHATMPQNIIVILDGDDWFPHQDVLKKINEVYSDPNVWLTYGQFKTYPGGQIGFCHDMPEYVVKNGSYREYAAQPSHLRTYYAWLFHQIKLKDLFYEGNFFAMTGDLAVSLPLIEMTGGKFKFIPEVMCIYNEENPLNDHKVNEFLQKGASCEIRSRPYYRPLETSSVNFRDSLLNANIDCIIFSYDRPQQLRRCLKSALERLSHIRDFVVIFDSKNLKNIAFYDAVQRDFPQVTFLRLENNSLRSFVYKEVEKRYEGYILFSLDNVIFTDSIDVSKCVSLLEETKAHIFSFLVGKDMIFENVRTLVKGVDLGVEIAGFQMNESVFAWQFKFGSGNWAQSHTLNTSLYRACDVLNGFEQFSLEKLENVRWNPNTDVLNKYFSKKGYYNEVGLCFEKVKTKIFYD